MRIAVFPFFLVERLIFFATGLSVLEVGWLQAGSSASLLDFIGVHGFSLTHPPVSVLLCGPYSTFITLCEAQR